MAKVINLFGEVDISASTEASLSKEGKRLAKGLDELTVESLKTL